MNETVRTILLISLLIVGIGLVIYVNNQGVVVGV